MSRFLLFYSWQSDSPNATNRSFIQQSLEAAAKSLRDDPEVTIEPVVDRDTAGVPGSPNIADTIFAKIDAASAFVADVSIVTKTAEGRSTPNPNVLVELGYALRALGPSRVLLVFNTALGKLEQLPFDLRHRRIVCYEASAGQSDRSDARKQFTKALAAAIGALPQPRTTAVESADDTVVSLKKWLLDPTKVIAVHDLLQDRARVLESALTPLHGPDALAARGETP